MHLKKIYKQIFNADFEEAGSELLLKEIIKKHPYFSTPYFFLAKKLSPAGPGFEEAAAMATLHFDHPYILSYQFSEVDKPEAFSAYDVIPDLKPMKGMAGAAVQIITADESSFQVDDTVTPAPTLSVPLTMETPAEEPMIFEPLFASDYFASQGIKLSEDVQPDDKLGKQLKSFTAWLKSMKKVHDSRIPPGNEVVDIVVQNLAEKSNQENEILTESMAEAYLQQGKKQKAREIYRKLSLLEPSKSAYFAAKMENTV